MLGIAGHAKEKIAQAVAGKPTRKHEEPVLESVGQDVQLIGADLPADGNIVFAANHIERIGDEEDVGPTLKGSKAPITQGPESTIHYGCKPATDAARRTLTLRVTI